jgi:Kef-type K+ transport system membrane component KefB
MVLTLQVLSATFAAKYTGRYKWHESVMVGLGMLGRAELAFIVIDIAYVDNHIIDFEQFYTLICAIFLLNLSVPTAIKWWEPYYMGREELRVFGVTISRIKQES